MHHRLSGVPVAIRKTICSESCWRIGTSLSLSMRMCINVYPPDSIHSRHCDTTKTVIVDPNWADLRANLVHMTAVTPNEVSVRIFQIVTGMLGGIFLYCGMDVRRKKGAQDFVASIWQVFMKVCSFSLIGVALGITFSVHRINVSDWMGLTIMTTGTAFVAAARHALGEAHTFTGQYRAKPQLVTRGIYSITRNPLYFGVLQCELGAALFVIHQLPMLSPKNYRYWLSILAVPLLYVVSFNWIMAMCESHYLERYFGDEYRRYRAQVPFLFPSIRLFVALRKEQNHDRCN
jgi:protein-S-isoprenylcysteine O-methyltransferase Ste14